MALHPSTDRNTAAQLLAINYVCRNHINLDKPKNRRYATDLHGAFFRANGCTMNRNKLGFNEPLLSLCAGYCQELRGQVHNPSNKPQLWFMQIVADYQIEFHASIG
jgi:hypothetical protein